jgi:hypothetical protein
MTVLRVHRERRWRHRHTWVVRVGHLVAQPEAPLCMFTWSTVTTNSLIRFGNGATVAFLLDKVRLDPSSSVALASAPGSCSVPLAVRGGVYSAIALKQRRTKHPGIQGAFS